jgi:hypothetical protein
MSNMCGTENEYMNLYLTQLFKTLGQLSAALLTTTLAVPVYSFYSRYYTEDRNINNYEPIFKNSDSSTYKSNVSVNEETLDDMSDNESTDLEVDKDE